MKNKELIEYLQQFSEDTPVSVVIANPEARAFYPVKDIGCLADEEINHPVFCIEVGDAENFNEEMIEICEEEEEKCQNT